MRSHFEPLRVRPERRLPADSSWPGHRPAQLTRCPAVGSDRHVGSDLGDDHLSGLLLDPGIVHNSRAAAAKGASCCSTASESRSI
jgi:hypothetical protein